MLLSVDIDASASPLKPYEKGDDDDDDDDDGDEVCGFGHIGCCGEANDKDGDDDNGGNDDGNDGSS